MPAIRSDKSLAYWRVIDACSISRGESAWELGRYVHFLTLGRAQLANNEAAATKTPAVGEGFASEESMVDPG